MRLEFERWGWALVQRKYREEEACDSIECNNNNNNNNNNGRYNTTCSTNCKYRTAATLCTLETWFVSVI